MENNKNTCEIVQDLLPLYVDGICSEASKELVRRHLAECPRCKEEVKRLKDMEIEEVIDNERNKVLQHHAKKEQSAAWRAGAIIAVILFIPVMIATIFAAAGDTDIGTVLVLTASMILAAALIVIPLMSKKNRFAKVILASTGAIVLIELFMNRFFEGGSFLQLVVPTIFGISVVFFPFLVKGTKLPEKVSNKKLLIVMCWDTLWLYLTVLAVTLKEHDYEGCRVGIVVSTFFVINAWLICLILRLSCVNRWMKAGVISVICGLVMLFANDVTEIFLKGNYRLSIFDANLRNWSMESSVDANIRFLVLVTTVVIGIVLFLIGMIKNKKQ